MFRHLTDFGYSRPLAGAVGFYLFYFVVTVLVAAASGGLVGLWVKGAGFQTGAALGASISMAFSLALSYVILRAKGLLMHPGYVLVAILGGLGAVFEGGLLGMIAPAFLSSRRPHQVEA